MTKKNPVRQTVNNDKIPRANLAVMTIGLVLMCTYIGSSLSKLPRPDDSLGFFVSTLVDGTVFGLICSLWVVVTLRLKFK